MCAQFFRQWSFVLAAADGHGFESHSARILHTKMSESADPLHGDDVTGTRTGIAQRVVNRHARAHKRPGFFRRQFIGNRRQRGRRCDHILGIAAIEIDTGDFAIDAHRKVTAPALYTDKIMPPVPADANALTFFPICNAAANCIDMSRDFVSHAAAQWMAYNDQGVWQCWFHHAHNAKAGSQLSVSVKSWGAKVSSCLVSAGCRLSLAMCASTRSGRSKCGNDESSQAFDSSSSRTR